MSQPPRAWLMDSMWHISCPSIHRSIPHRTLHTLPIRPEDQSLWINVQLMAHKDTDVRVLADHMCQSRKWTIHAHLRYKNISVSPSALSVFMPFLCIFSFSKLIDLCLLSLLATKDTSCRAFFALLKCVMSLNEGYCFFTYLWSFFSKAVSDQPSKT